MAFEERGDFAMHCVVRIRDWLLAATLAVNCCVAFPASLSAQDIGDDDELRATRVHGPYASGLRTAKCLIKVQGIEYLRGFCTFIPSDKKDGSFHIVTTVNKHFLKAEVVLSAPASKDAVAYWNGPNGERTLVELGPAHSEGACWRVGNAKGKDETRLCAWNSLAADQPTPKEPPQDTKDFVYYGMRIGMYDAIDSKVGIDTDRARIVTKKSRDAAIINCRRNGDFTAECIERVLHDAPTPILTANCSAGTFAYALGSGGCDHCEPPQTFKFLGKNLQSDGGPDFLIIQNLKSGSTMDGSWASTYTFAADAYELLCPKTLEKARPAPQ
jgi:hypothetical protein